MKSILSRVWETGDIYKAEYEGELSSGAASAWLRLCNTAVCTGTTSPLSSMQGGQWDIVCSYAQTHGLCTGTPHSGCRAQEGYYIALHCTAGWYCVGCEAYKDDSEMEGDHLCPTHKKRCIEREEENYFFALSKYQSQIQVGVVPGSTLQSRL